MAVGMCSSGLLTSLWAQETGAQAGTNGRTETVTVGNRAVGHVKHYAHPVICCAGFHRLPRSMEGLVPVWPHSAAFSVLWGMF